MNFTIKQARLHAGMTQQVMADYLGIDRSTYIRIEKNPTRATVGQVNAISKYTGIPVEDIFLGCNSTKVETEEFWSDLKRN